MSDQQHDPNWYPDPVGRHEYRWWDGMQWTDQVSSHGRQSTSSLEEGTKHVVPQQQPDKVARQVQKHVSQAANRGAPQAPLASSPNVGLLEYPLLVINQKWKIFEVNSEFAIMDPNGTQVGSVRQVGQSKLKKVVRFLGDVDQYFTHKFQVVDAQGVPQLLVTRPRKFVKSRVVVEDAVGQPVGEIVQKNVFGKIKFGFVIDGREIGGIFAENWRAWNFSIQDATGQEIARITKTFEGLLKTGFTIADNYVLQVHTQDMADPLRKLVYASALTVDVALKQDARGFSPLDVVDGFT